MRITRELLESIWEKIGDLTPVENGELTVKRYDPPISREKWIHLKDLDPHIYTLIYSAVKLYSPRNRDDFIDTIYKYMDRLGRWLKKDRKIYSEDHPKKKILLISPSNRQLRHVWGGWNRYAWRMKTLDGDETPVEEGWARDLMKIAEALKGEGVEPLVAADTGVEKLWRDIYGDVLSIHIPDRLFKIGYVRDPSLTLFREPIIGSMALDIRSGEEDVAINIFRKVGLDPIYSVTPEVVDGDAMTPYVEGGNFIAIDTDPPTIFTGVGVRGTNHAGIKSLARILPGNIRLIGIPISGYLRDWTSGAVHLDVVMMYISNGYRQVFIDPSRMGLYSFLEYDRARDRFMVRNGLEVFRELEIYVDEPPREGTSNITMVNALNLGGNKILVDSYNRKINRFLESWGADVIEVDIPHIEAGGGGVRCATKEVWIG